MSQQASGRQPFSRNAMVLAPLKRQALPGFPPELEWTPNLNKVNLEVLKPWIATRITELMGGVEDEVLIGMVCNILSEGPHPSGRDMYAGLLSFLESQTPLFLRELWGHLRSAEANALPGVPGIPQFLLDAKREELAQRAAATTRMQHLLAEPRDTGSALPPPPPRPLPPPPPLPKPPLGGGGPDRQGDRSPGRAPRWDDRKDGPSKRERSRSGDRRRGRHSRSRSRERSCSRRRERRRGSESDDSRERKHKRKHKHRSRKHHRSRSRSRSRSGEKEPDMPPPMPQAEAPPPPVDLYFNQEPCPEVAPLPLALWQQKLADGEEP